MKFILVSWALFFSLQCTGQGVADLVQQAAELFQNKEYEKAIPVAAKAAAEIEQYLGKDNIFYTAMITIQASGYWHTYQYAKAEQLFIQLCTAHKNSSDRERDQHYATCLNNLATLYNDMGQYEKAEPLLIESKELTKKVFGEFDSTYSYSLNNLAGLYHSMGQYQKAEPLYIQAVAVRKKVYGETHPGYATSLNNLGTLYLEMGQPDKAEPLFIQSKDIRRKALGEMNSDYAMSLNNLASLYEETEDYTKAEALYVQANTIRKKILGEAHPDYAMGLNNLASLYARLGQFKKSEALILQARNTWKTVLGENHPIYATSINNLAALYRKSQTEYAQSEQLYKQAIELRKRILGINHPLYADSENDLALLYSNMRQYAREEPHLLSGSQSVLQNMQNTFTVLSEKEKSNYLQYNFLITEINNSYLYNYSSASAEATRNSFNLQLGFKSLSLSDTRRMLESVRNSQDVEVKKVFNNWQVNKILLAKQYSLPVANRLRDLAKLEAETEALEKELSRRSAAFRNQQTAMKVTFAEVKGKLAADEAAIEFVRFRLYTSKWTDSVIYGAYVFTGASSSLRFVPLFEEKQLQRLMDSAGKGARDMVNSFYRGFGKKNNNAGTLGAGLYNLVWAPLEPYLAGIKKISYSPAGKLYGIAFHALPMDTTRLLIDQYRLEQYTSTRQIALRGTEPAQAKPGSIVLFGDARFSMDSAQLVKQRIKFNESSSPSIPLVASRSNRGGIWNSLPGTAEEVKRIGQLFEGQHINTTTYIQADASEENLKKLDGHAPQILHVATHGFFLPEPGKRKERSGDNTYSLARDPLMRSGLVMAGGNYVWTGGKPLEGVEDGIATAYEISQLDLGHTDLVVLSACETALGDVKGSEGVFGLQRSFKMAGVDNLVVSLWQVPDKETVELMTTFYTYRMQGKPTAESFYLAQGEMRKKYPPFYWAAFVLVQ